MKFSEQEVEELQREMDTIEQADYGNCENCNYSTERYVFDLEDGCCYVCSKKKNYCMICWIEETLKKLKEEGRI